MGLLRALSVGVLLSSGLFASEFALAQTQSAENKDKKVKASASTSGKISQIKIEGNKKIETDAVNAKLQSRVGILFDQSRIREDVQALFETGFFYDIEVDMQNTSNGVVLIYRVTEKPTVAEIAYKGNFEITEDDIKEAAGLKPYEILNYNKINEAIDKIQKLYEDKGYFLSTVKYELEDIIKGETQRLTLKIQENDRVVVKKISVLGNKSLTDGKIKSVLNTKEDDFFSFMSGAGAFKQEAFDVDLRLLNYLYYNEGFILVKIDRPQVYVSPDKKNLFITMRVEEGEKFDVGKIDFEGDLLFPEEELRATIDIDDSKTFVYSKMQKDLQKVTEKYGDLGYAFANVIPKVRPNESTKKVDVTFEIDKGHKVYFGKINVIGNSKTRDKVIRRELKIVEGELYNETRKRESLENVQRLGFFEEIHFNNNTPEERQDILNIDIVVKERNTGTIQIGAGYSTYSGAVFQGQINQINFLGRGQKLGINLDISKKRSVFNFNFTEPSFLDTEWSLGVDAYQRKDLLADWDKTVKGGALRVGHPLAEYLSGFLRYRMDDTEVTLKGDEVDQDTDLYPVETVNGITSSVQVAIEYDRRDDRFAPTKGLFAGTSLEYAGIGGDLDYTLGSASLRYFNNLFWSVVWRNNLTYRFITSNDDSKEVPFSERFFLGGPYTLRGYDPYAVGKKKRSQVAYDRYFAATLDPVGAELAAMRPFGGTQQAYYQMEFEFSLIDEAKIKGVLFYDIGNADDVLRASGFRSDMGFGFRWFSPIGPLRFEWGIPINRKEQERAVVFNFSIGSPF